MPHDPTFHHPTPSPRNLTPTERRLLDCAAAVATTGAAESGDLAFLARILVQANLPYRDPGACTYVRRNGDFTLTLQAPPDVGLPYGRYPRLMLAWLCREALRTRSREIHLGESLSDFMRTVGVTPSGGPNGPLASFRRQAARLFSTTISCSWSGGPLHASGEAGRPRRTDGEAPRGLGDGDLVGFRSPIPRHAVSGQASDPAAAPAREPALAPRPRSAEDDRAGGPAPVRDQSPDQARGPVQPRSPGRSRLEIGTRIASRSMIWWAAPGTEPPGHSGRQPDAGWLVLSPDLYDEILAHPVPLDRRVLAALTSSFALDLYAWATYRMSCLQRPVSIHWSDLARQFGSRQRALRNFRFETRRALERIAVLYPRLRYKTTSRHLHLYPSSTHTSRRPGHPPSSG